MKLLSKGNTAEIFEYSNNTVCKLFYQGYPQFYAEHEFNNAKAVFRAGIKTPRAHEFVYIDGRDGIIYDRVMGEELSSKLYEADGKSALWFEKFAQLHKELLSCDIDSVIDYRDFLKTLAADSRETIRLINGLKSGSCLLHGDYHPKNVMIDASNRLILIDVMNVCKGPAEYDIARTYFLLGFDKDLQNRYLSLMNCQKESIEPYLEVIGILRENERKK